MIENNGRLTSDNGTHFLLIRDIVKQSIINFIQMSTTYPKGMIKGILLSGGNTIN